MCVHAWQMYLSLSAWLSLSISPDSALTAVQRPLSMSQQAEIPVQVVSCNLSRRPFLWLHLICLYLFLATQLSSLSLYPSSQSKQPFFQVSVFCFALDAIIPAHSALRHHALQYVILQCGILTSLAAMSDGTSSITS